MNTFHYTTQQLVTNTDKSNCNQQFQILSEIREVLQKQQSDVFSNIKGFAIKLSKMRGYGIELHDLLSITQNLIIIDAEEERLDYLIQAQVNLGLIHFADLDRLVITVQVKRLDADEQLNNLKYFQQFGLKIVLVAGHNSYLINTQKSSTNVTDRFIQLAQICDVFLFGLGANLRQKLESKGFLIDADKILELQGYQKIANSNLWIYYAGESLTNEAISYIKRRNSTGNFIARGFHDVEDLTKKRSSFLFIDRCCHTHFKLIFMILDQLIRKNIE